jgi:hypothetical protein
MRGIKHKKVKTYDGVSEFAMTHYTPSYNHCTYISIMVYNIIKPSDWSRRRKSFVIVTFGNDGVNIGVSHYRSDRLGIDVDRSGNLVCDGVDWQ